MNSQHKVVSSALNINDETKKIDKYYILKETQTFNESKFSEDNSRFVLVELIYSLNQGFQFNDSETETIFFRITKLFQLNNPKLRQIMYKALKVYIILNNNKIIMPQKYVHILIQCITKDLMCDDQQIQLQALKFISSLENEQYIEQVERFIKNALLDTNLLISSAALIVGIHIINKYPNIVGKWLFEVIQRLGQTKQNLKYHALILLHEMKRTNISQFIKILNQMINEQQQPLVQLQIIWFIEEILPYLSNQQKQPLINYLLEMANNQNQMLSLSSISTLVKTLEVKNQVIYPLISGLNSIIYQTFHYLNKFAALRVIENLINYSQRLDLFDELIMMHVKVMAFSYRFPVAQKSQQIIAKFFGESAPNEFKNVFQNVKEIEWQYNFLDGLLELVTLYPIYGCFALNFMKVTTIKYDIEMVSISIQIIDQILMSSQKTKNQILLTLFKITQQQLDVKLQFQVIRIITNFYFQINIDQLDFQQTNLIYGCIKVKLQQMFQTNQEYNYEIFLSLRDIFYQYQTNNSMFQANQYEQKKDNQLN